MRRFLILALAVAGIVRASDREFDAIVRSVEARYDTTRQHIPMFGLVNFFVKVVRPAGASDLKLAIFSHLGRPMFAEEEDFSGLVRESLGSDWRPFVRAHSRRDDEWTCIYSAGSGKNWKLLLATLERREATILRIRLNPDGMLRWVMHPGESGRRQRGD